MKQKFIRQTLAILLVSFVLGFSIGGDFSLDEQISFLYGWIDLDQISTMLFSFARWMLPQIVLCRFLGNYMEEEFLSKKEYIFTRTRKTERFFARIYLKLTIKSLIACLFFFVLPICSIGINSITMMAVMKMIIWSLYQTACLLFINGFSCIVPSIYGMGILFVIESMMWMLKKISLYRSFLGNYLSLPLSDLTFFDGARIKNIDSGIGVIGFEKRFV